MIEDRVDRMEHSVGSILSKIEHVLEQLSLVEVGSVDLWLPRFLIQVKRDESGDLEGEGNAAFLHDMTDQVGNVNLGYDDILPVSGSHCRLCAGGRKRWKCYFLVANYF